MAVRFDLVTLDVADSDAQAAFWSDALDLVETEREDGDRWIVLSDASGTRRVGLQRGVPRPGSMHLDLVCEVSGFDEELARLVSLGARLLVDARREPFGSIANLADPEGNPFDLCAYETR